MSEFNIPEVFSILLSDKIIDSSDIIKTADGFCMIYKSLSDILAQKDIFDFPSDSGEKFLCNRFFDDWFLYALRSKNSYTYSLLKLREQEHDLFEDIPADGDTPGVTICFISFDCEILKSTLFSGRYICATHHNFF